MLTNLFKSITLAVVFAIASCINVNIDSNVDVRESLVSSTSVISVDFAENVASAASLEKEIKKANKKLEKKGIRRVKKVYRDIADDHIDGAESILRTHFDYYSKEAIYQDAWSRFAALTDAGPGVYEVTFDLTHRRKEDRQRAKREMSNFRQIVKNEGFAIKKVAANRYKVKID